jgi:hypothetical protein
MRRTFQGTKWLSRRRSNASVECRTLSRNFGCHYSRIVLTGFEAVWNKPVELTWFCAGCAFARSFVSDYVCRDHTENKGNMTSRCLVYWCAVPPVFCTLLCCLELLVFLCELWACDSGVCAHCCLCFELRQEIRLKLDLILKIFTGLSTYIISKAV